ncbi:DUF3883 domain-containing protein [Janibacter melonis]|uniref:DUF3883 domain-containing protein n=1 Tax=Janibacter melonis TaxID=262209 RepID=A0A5P8FPC9_9MICO|nr:DUF3883 domain-containing protein [Janibacter melonis]QFQ31425.1 DUF3883 domain-containing protein [Janibacter melonis]
MPSEKQAATDVLTNMLGLALIDVTGIQRGTVPARVFRAAAERAGVAYRSRTDTTEEIIRLAGLPWYARYDSRESESMGGGNVTALGLRALAEALVILDGGAPATHDEEDLWEEAAESWIEPGRWTSRARAQGRMLDAERRHKVEMAAQGWLMWMFARDGWHVEDTHLIAPYDAIARRRHEVVYLEAKGTTTRGASVIVTRAEVAWAREHPGQCILGVWSGMIFDDEGEINPDVGQNTIQYWYPEDADLDPIGFDYRVDWPEE